MRGGRGQKMSVFVHAQGKKTVHAGEGTLQKAVFIASFFGFILFLEYLILYFFKQF